MIKVTRAADEGAGGHVGLIGAPVLRPVKEAAA
jgi:hypothetical protein